MIVNASCTFEIAGQDTDTPSIQADSKDGIPHSHKQVARHDGVKLMETALVDINAAVSEHEAVGITVACCRGGLA